MESLLGILVGVGLAASCGFRVFVPLLVVSIAAQTGYLAPSEGFDWMRSWPAVVAFAIATIVETAAYYVPWLDNALDTIASPVAVVAGTILFAAFVTDLDPMLQWSLAVIAGGGAAGAVQGGTVVTRLASSTTTGGIANPLFNTLETAAGVVFSILAIVVPVVAVLLLVAVMVALYYTGRRVLRAFFRRKAVAAEK